MRSSDLTFTCRCGRVQLVAQEVTPAVANRVACHCGGCTAFAQRSHPEILDDWGGTERLQVIPACLVFLRGRQDLRCIQQTHTGALRWIAGCCGASVGLTLASSRIPFVGLDVHRLDPKQADALLEIAGPLRARVNWKTSDLEARAFRGDARSLLGMLLHLAPLTWRWWVRGDHHRSPFFEDGRPAVEVEPLYTLDAAGAGCR